ncbi:MAG: universal stress protein [Gaiellaceae bacterium]
MKVIAAIDQKRTIEAALASAIEFARRNEAELVVVGVVTPGLYAPQPAYGERVRRYRQTELALTRAVSLTRTGGLVAEGVIR